MVLVPALLVLLLLPAVLLLLLLLLLLPAVLLMRPLAVHVVLVPVLLVLLLMPAVLLALHVVLQHRLLVVEVALQLVVRMVVLLQRCERCCRSAFKPSAGRRGGGGGVGYWRQREGVRMDLRSSFIDFTF